MSPEQLSASHNVDGRTDIWALGIVLYEALTGVRPFTAEVYPALILQISGDPVPPMGVPLPDGLEAVVLRCLEKDVRRRYLSVRDLANDLAPFSRDRRSADVIVDRIRGMSAPQERRSDEVTSQGHRSPSTLNASAGAIESTRRTKRYTLGGIALGLAVAGLLVVIFTRGDGAGTPAPTPAPGAAPLAEPPPPSPSPSGGASTGAGTATSPQPAAAVTSPETATAATPPPATAATDLAAPAKTESELPKPSKTTRTKPSAGSSSGTRPGAATTTRTNTTADVPGRAPDPTPPPRTEAAPAPPQAEPPPPDDPRALLRRRR
jgi:serine/threonine-protein kinase